MIVHAIIGTVVAIFVGFVMRDSYAWLPRFQKWLLKRAAARLPVELRETYYEELLAEIEQLPPAELSRTVRVLGFIVAAGQIRNECIGYTSVLGEVGTRIFEIVLASSIAILLGPLLIAIVLLVKRSSGPITFGSETIGKGKRTFVRYKFRTMYANHTHAMQANGPTKDASENLSGDPQMTPAGLWLQITSLDEIPMLVNVLRGDMALVGLRPCPAAAFQALAEATRQTYAKYRPGMISPSGVEGLRCQEAFDFDVEYMKRRNLLRDIAVVLCALIVSVTPMSDGILRKLGI